MISRLKHIAVVSQNQFLAGKFYELLFGLRPSGSGRGVNAAVLSDGYVGFNINGRRPGGIARLDHFGFEVSDVEERFARGEIDEEEFRRRLEVLSGSRR